MPVRPVASKASNSSTVHTQANGHARSARAACSACNDCRGSASYSNRATTCPRRTGASAGATIDSVQWLELSGFVNIIKADYKEFQQTGGTAAAPVVLDVSDSDFAMIPEESYGASARFELPLASGLGRVSLRGSWYQQTHMEITDINVANAVRVGEGQIPGYDTFDASPHALRPLF